MVENTILNDEIELKRNNSSGLPDASSHSLTPMMSQYLKIKEKHLDEILFYRMGDFYEMFFNDAVLASSILDITLTKRGKHEEKDIPMCGIPFHSSENYLSKLIDKGYRVAICEQVITPEEEIKRNRGPMEREVVRILTPGTILEENYFNDSNNNFLCSWNEVAGEQAVSWIDLSTGVFFVEKLDNNISIAFETTLERLSPRELILPEKMKEKKPINFKGCVSVQADSMFQTDICEDRLKRFYKIKSLESFGSFNRASISVSGAILGYINLTQKGKLPLLKRISEWKTSEVMEIDTSSRNSLELIKTQTGEKSGSFFNSINKTVTGGGARLLLERLNGPSLNKSLINQRLDTVSNFIEAKTLRNNIRDLLRGIPDIERSLTRLQFSRGGPRDILSLKIGCNKARIILSLICNHRFKKSSVEINRIQKNLNIETKFVKKLEQALSENPPYLARDGNFIKEGFSDNLDKIKLIRDKSRDHILLLQKKYIEDTKIQSLKIKYNNVLGYHVEIRRIHETTIQDKNYFIHRQTTAQASRYTTTELANLEKELMSAGKRALEIELNIFEELVTECKKYSDELLNVFSAISLLDVSISFSEIADIWDYCRPEITKENIFSVVSGRHPVVEQSLFNNSDIKFVGNDCNLNDQKNLWLITGPNMGGKSTFLRQNALVNILAQMGSYVPAKKAKIGITDRVFSRVGSGDDLSKGQSTFMVEMIETASILNLATNRSFVILDEIGRGTATWDGLSLAWSVIENIHNKINCKTLFATHYHELTKLSKTLKKLSLFSLEAKEFNEEIIFLYNLIPGSANKSYGLQVAKLAGIPSDVVKRANEILKELENEYSIEKKLPLFEIQKNPKEENENQIKLELKKTNPDDITPLQAIDLIYKLKKMDK